MQENVVYENGIVPWTVFNRYGGELSSFRKFELDIQILPSVERNDRVL